MIVFMSSKHNLDLRGVACPLNFVRVKLYLDRLVKGDVVDVLLDAGEPKDSVSTSLKEEGHELLMVAAQAEGHYCLSIRKA
jgi:sulfite reductase (ferredoxin)